MLLAFASGRHVSNTTLSTILINVFFQGLSLRMHKLYDVSAIWHVTNTTLNPDHLIVHAKKLVR